MPIQKRVLHRRRITPDLPLSSCRVLLALLILCAATAPLQAADHDFQAGKQAYLNGDYHHAYAILSPLAAHGNADAQKMLGVMYDYGQGVKKDPKQALDWYLKAAGQGQSGAQLLAGNKYFQGDGTTQDYAKAAKWWQKAAAGGQVDAQFNLGLMYSRGLGVKQDDNRAAKLFRAAAEQGHAHAEYSLGVMYAFGRGVHQDYGTARKWFTRAAKQGVAQAQFNLGVFYENGYGVKADAATAAKWYERAAAQGLSQAETRLAALDVTAPEQTPVKTAKAGAAASETPATRATTTPAQTAATSAQAAATPAKPPAAGKVPATTTDTGSEPTATEAGPAAAAPGIRRADWIMQLSPDSYTLQIGSLTDEQAVIDFIRDHNLQSRVAYIKVVINGVTRYNALYGHYDTYDQAKAAAANLTTTLGGVKPWVRNIGLLQKLLK